MAGTTVITKQLPAAVADGIAEAQTPGAAGPITLDGSLVSGGVANLVSQRQVIITTTADETGKTATITGTVDGQSQPVSETVQLPDTDEVATTTNFATVTSVVVSDALTGDITVGTNGVGASGWVLVDRLVNPFVLGLGIAVDGTVNYSIQITYDDIQTIPAPQAFAPTDFATKTAALNGQIATPFAAWRLLINSGDGAVRAVGIQPGVF